MVQPRESTIMSVRIGQGFDVHAFTEGSEIVLGGVTIPFSHALKAHSDGDVLIHAICDALLGAAALGDIGHHFPDNDDAFADANSRDLLLQVVTLLKKKGLSIVNLDATIIAQVPKMAPHIQLMRKHLAADCGLSVEQVNVKATTTERLGFTGRGEGIACQAIVLLETA